MQPPPSVFSQITSALYPSEFARCAESFRTQRPTRGLSAYDHWIQQTSVGYLIRNSILSLEIPLISQLSTINSQLPLAGATYTGGYVLPGTTPLAGQTAL